MESLDFLAKKHKTDKSSDIHNYCVKYEKYFPFNREDKMRILEIGVLGGSSLKMWKDFYYNSHIIGIDINESNIEYQEDRISIEIGSQSNEDFLRYLGGKYISFDLIVDDGSHINEHVIKSFEYLFPFVRSQGVYVVEDCCTSYWEEYNGGIYKPTSIIEYFKRLVDDVNFKGNKNFDFHNVNARREDVLLKKNTVL